MSFDVKFLCSREKYYIGIPPELEEEIEKYSKDGYEVKTHYIIECGSDEFYHHVIMQKKI